MRRHCDSVSAIVAETPLSHRSLPFLQQSNELYLMNYLDCRGTQIVTSGNINDFKDCTIIEGSITILDQTFAGFQEVYPK